MATSGGAPPDLPIVVAVYCDGRTFGGAEQSLGNLIAELSPAVDVAILAVDAEIASKLAERRPSASVTVLAAVRNKLDLRSFASHVSALRRLRPDVFHANLATPASCRYGILAAALIPGIRIVVVEQLPYPLGRLQLALKRLSERRVAAHVAVGKRSSREIERLVGLRPNSVRTIYNGVPDIPYVARPPRRGHPVVGTVARLDRQKGIDVLIRALALVPEVTAIVVGDGPERAALERLAATEEVTDRIVFEGWKAEPRERLADFDVFVLPSRFEAFPLAIVEAMLASLPVVATAVGSVPEAVEEGQTGFLIPPDDEQELAIALRRLLDDEPLRRALGSRGREIALDRFTASAMTRAYEGLYREVLA